MNTVHPFTEENASNDDLDEFVHWQKDQSFPKAF